MSMSATWPIKINTATFEAGAVNAIATVAPFLALSPAAWITGTRLVEFLSIPLWAAIPMALGVESLGLAIIATRVMLTGRDMPKLEKRMDAAFVGYLIVVVSVNGVLAAVNMGGLTGWVLVQAIGKAVAEMVLALMALPASQLVGVRHELSIIDACAATLKAEQAQAVVDERDERERAEDRASAQVLALRQIEIDAQAAESDKKRAARATAKITTPKTSAESSVSVVAYRNKKEMAAALIPAFIATNRRVPSLAEVSEMLSVEASMASTYRKPYKNA